MTTTEVSAIVADVLRYFLRQPHTADTLAGVARWHLRGDRDIGRQIEEVDGALTWLVAVGFLLAESAPGGLPKFSLNDAKLAEAEELAACAHPQDDPARPPRPLESKPAWGDLVLPPDRIAQLNEVCQRARYRQLVYDTWGFGRARPLGFTVLFTGPPGTGKTMAAQVIAADLGVHLCRIDLAAVVSKYVGETEKNLDRIFAAATDDRAVVLFDEADALCVSHPELRDSHDRYAAFSSLWRNAVAYDGITILIAGNRQDVDDACVRRLHAIVDFPFPDAPSRREIWKRVFPETAPVDAEVDFEVLAREIELAGSSIRAIALAAAFYGAAGGNHVIGMHHVARAARREHEKLARSWDAAVLLQGSKRAD